ncbi:hypothetical protein DTO271D3_3718 [Paecilomyces variotii]|nr:hypothetical protein DTO271D3_3718 [Paecilomyces variotii]
MVVNPKKNSFGDEITVWTEFQLPKSEKFRGKKWSDFFLLIRTTHGQGYSWWGPVLERQDPYNNTMLLVQVYASHEALLQFRESDQYEKYWSILSEVSGPKVRLFRARSLRLLTSLRKGTALVTAYFPWPVSQSQRESVIKLEGIWGFGLGMRAAHLAPMHHPYNIKLWAMEPEQRNGQKVQAMVWLHPWKDAEKERKHKSQEAFFEALRRNMNKEDLTGMEKVYQGLEDTGAIEYIEEHCAFELIPDVNVARDRSLDSEGSDGDTSVHIIFSLFACISLLLCLWRFCASLS